MMRDVTCPIVRRASAVLAFRHPLAGLQLVKRGVEAGETPAAATLRELREESGVAGRDPVPLAVRDDVHPGERWHLVAVRSGPLPDRWVHRTADDGGQGFAFFWQVEGDPEEGFDARYRRVLACLRTGAAA